MRSWRRRRDAELGAGARSHAFVDGPRIPREAFAFNSLGTALAQLGQYDQSLDPFREAIRLDSRFMAPHSNLATSLIALNQFDAAKKVLEDAFSRNMEVDGFRRLLYQLAFVADDRAAMARYFEMSTRARSATAYGWEGHTAAFAGRLTTAHDEFRRGIQMAKDDGRREAAAQMSAEDAEAHAIVGQCAEARAEAAGARELGRDNFTLERVGRVLGLCGTASDVAAWERELVGLFPEATVTLRVSLPIALAAQAVQQRDPRRALELLEPVRPYDHAPKAVLWPFYLRGLAQLQLKDGASAAAQFQNVLEHRGDDTDSQLYPLAYLGLARAAALTGDTVRARKAYDDLLALWKNADGTLEPLREARQESARIR